MSALDLPVFDYQGITLATVIPEDCRTVESEVEVFGELTGWVTEEADLEIEVSLARSTPLPNRSKDVIIATYVGLRGGVEGSTPGFHTGEVVSDGDGGVSTLSAGWRIVDWTYTKASLTDTTKTWPASLSFSEFMYPGMWLVEQPGPRKL